MKVLLQFYLTAITFISTSILGQSFGQLVVPHDPRTDGHPTKKLIRISAVYDEFKIQNFNPNSKAPENGITSVLGGALSDVTPVENMVTANTGHSDHQASRYGAVERYLILKRDTANSEDAIPKIDDFTAEPSDTKVILQVKVSPPCKDEIANCRISGEVKLLGCEIWVYNFANLTMNTRTSSITLAGLHPYARYQATVTPHIRVVFGRHQRSGRPKTIEFKTLESVDPPTSVVRNLRFISGSNRIEWDQPMDCTITGPTEYTKLVIKDPNGLKVWEGVSGANHTYYNLESVGLAPFTLYEVSAYVSRDSEGRRYNPAGSQTMLFRTPPAEKFIKIWFLVFPVIGISLLLLYIWYRKHKKKPAISKQPSYLEIIPLSSTIVGGNSSAAPDAPDNLVLQPNAETRRTSAYLYSIPNEPDSWRVPVKNFEEYVKNAVTSAQLNSQFKLLPEGSTKPSDYGKLPENIQKNRSTSLIAYDDTRVILRKIPGDPYSDYINANYIRGFGKERAYIATQGPMSNTVEDFWRMIWQKDVRIVCMLTNVVEDGEDKCVQYWPNIRAEVRYGDIVILNEEHQVFADFTFRSFKLHYQQQSRKVAHLHYTGWPSFGIPTYPQSLALYLKKLLKLPTGDGPVVVHCNTGDDRTGTIIVCDICLREVVQTKAINVPDVTTRLRESRANMVGTLQQFLLAHIIITEVLMVLPTQVPCDKILPKRMRQLRNRLAYDIERLNETMWKQQTLKSLAEPKPLGIADDADDDLPGEGTPEVVYDDMNPTFENRISQIGGVSVDGVKMKGQHLASHLPTSLKLSDFWRFVTENDVKLIIILQCSDPGNPSCSDVMPDESIVHQMPDIEFAVETNRQNDADDEYFKSEKVTLVETSQENAEPQSVTVLTCRGWARGSNGKPPEPVALVSLWTASERIPRKEGQTLVLCHDGITACGLYLAMSFLLERMAVERECDVISAVRAVRRSRPEFVQSVKQCEYLYNAAKTYAENFQNYSNFT